MGYRGKKHHTTGPESPWDDTVPTGTSSGWKSTVAEKCHVKHPTLQLGNGTLVGASCNNPRPGFDVYVGFDWGQKSLNMHQPWKPDTHPVVVEGKFEIADMGVPQSKEDFDALIAWLAQQLEDGKNVHIGCIGGHGRTGLVMSALIRYMTGEEDAIQWVRDNHCTKAVESDKQVDWLHKHYGIKKQKATKSSWTPSTFDGKYPAHSKGNGYVHGGNTTTNSAPSNGIGLKLKAGMVLGPMDGPLTLFDVV